MLMAGDLIEAISVEENTEGEYKNHNNDHDFGEVLNFYASKNNKTEEYKIRYSDGTEEAFQS